MKADEGRMHSINEKAKALAKCKPSELCEEISMHFRMLNSRWENLRQLAASRKNMLDKAARFLLFKRNAEEVEVRMNEKVAVFWKFLFLSIRQKSKIFRRSISIHPTTYLHQVATHGGQRQQDKDGVALPHYAVPPGHVVSLTETLSLC